MARDQLALLNGIAATAIAATLLMKAASPNGVPCIPNVAWAPIEEGLTSWGEALGDGLILWGP